MKENMSVREAIYTIFQMKSQDYANREMDLTFITYEILDNIPQFKNEGWVTETLRPKVTQAIQSFLPKTINGKSDPKSDSLLVRVPNGRGGYKSGVYKLRRKPRTKQNVKIAPVETGEVSVENAPYVDAAGRTAVCSELLFRGYDVTQMTVGDYFDVVAVKQGKSYLIQTKTVLIRNTAFSIRISEKSYGKIDFLIAVIRTTKNRKQIVNQCLVIPSEDLKRWRSSRKATLTDKTITITFTQKDNHIYLKDEIVDGILNNFAAIK